MQEFLTGLFEMIFVSFTLIMVLDFTAGLNHLLPSVRSQNDQDVAPNTDAIALILTAENEKAKPTADTRNATIVPTTSAKPPALLPDPWTLPIDEQEQVTLSSASSSQQPAKLKPLLLLPPARPRLDLAALKKYLLHGKTVVRVEDITTILPDGLKQYKLRGKSVLRLADLEAAIA